MARVWIYSGSAILLIRADRFILFRVIALPILPIKFAKKITGMRRKRLPILIASLLILVACLVWVPVQWKVRKEIRIDAQVEYVSSAITNLHHWKNWNAELIGLDSTRLTYSDFPTGINAFLQSPTQRYTITEFNPEYVLVRTTGDGSPEYQSLSAISDTLDKSTEVIWIRLLSPFRWLKEKILPGSQMDQSLKHLKFWMEDPLHIYGFPISTEPVIDTLVITSIATCEKNKRIASLAGLYNRMLQYAKEKKIPIGNNRMASFSFSGKDSIRIAAGIPAKEKGPSEAQISVLEMPGHGKMLVGHYEGPYYGIGRLYSAMERYVRDKRLLRVAAVYEKYLTDPKTAQDSLHMRIELHYPIY
jgi:effector-binding domain-containing protein